MEQFELTPRERDILDLLCKGYSDRAIAEHLVLSPGTVKWYNKQIFSKLGVNNRVQATLAARALDIVSANGSDPSGQNLPVTLTSFIGRTDNIHQLCDLLQNQPLITIVGPGGIGKTRLAVEVAKKLYEDQRLAHSFVPLASYTRTDAVPVAIADSLGISVRDQESALGQVIDRLSQEPTLLILDNFEHVIEASACVNEISRAVSDVRLLVTSRERLNIYGEMVYRLDGLPFTTVDTDQDLCENEAIALFVDRARLVDASFRPTADQLQHIAQICQLLHGMPLAIEHAASWTHVMDVEAIKGEIEDGIDILRTNLSGVEPRHRSMRAVIDRSWERLTRSEKHAMMRLSVFRGGFARDAAADVAQADLDILSSLVARSFVYRSARDRFNIQEVHRQYAFEKLAEAGETDAARKQHAGFFNRLVWDICPQRFGADYDPGAMDRLDDDYANLREAVRWALSNNDACIALSIVGRGAYFFEDRGHRAEGVVWAHEALENCREGHPDLQTRAYFLLLQKRGSRELCQTYLECAHKSANQELIAEAHMVVGAQLMFHHGALDDAERYLLKAIDLYRESSVKYMAGFAHYDLGLLEEKRGNLALAARYHRHACTITDEAGMKCVVPPVELARALMALSDEDEVPTLLQHGMDNAIYARSPKWTSIVLRIVATYFRRRGRLEVAVQLLSVCYHVAILMQFAVEHYQEAADALRMEVGQTRFEEWWASGKSLSLQDAISLSQQTLEEIA